MKIVVPEGKQKSLNFVLKPTQPVDGQAGDWHLLCVEHPDAGHVSSLEFLFSPDTPPNQRRSERASMVVTIDSSVQSNETSWRFMTPGMVFAADAGDYKDCFSCDVCADQGTLTIDVQCLDDEGETFKFSFLAMRTNNISGECQVLASKDPAGLVGRKK
jgi:hypothetical protein